MLAQVVDTTWPSVFLQAGAFGLLAYIVIVLYPKSVSEARVEREQRDIRYETLVHLLQGKFEERNNAIVNAVRDQTESWIEELKREVEVIKLAVKSICKHP